MQTDEMADDQSVIKSRMRTFITQPNTVHS